MMKKSFRLALGFLIGPWIVAPVVVGIFFSLTGFFYDALAQDMALFAVMVAYAHALLFGLPAYWLLKKFHALSFPYIMLTGFLAGFMGANLLMMYSQFGHSSLKWGETLAVGIFYGLWGLPVAFAIWFIGVRERHPAVKVKGPEEARDRV